MHRKLLSSSVALFAIAATVAAPASSSDLPASCVIKQNQRLVDPQQPLPPNAYFIDLVNNCGVCAHISTNTTKNGSFTDFARTFSNVGAGETRTDRMNVSGVGNWELIVVKVETCN